MYNNYILNTQFNAGIYIRLSQEDRDNDKKYESESESVLNQREMLMNYVKNNNFNFVNEYVDDGYSGTDFERPGFKKLIEDINNNKINLVIVKDLSRLGRDHILTGYYMETFFPEKRVRFISILESYDSFKNQASNDSSTFIIACNDYYSKQNSIKIKNVLNSKRSNGKFIGSLPCFGYMRDPNDKGHLIPNPETAPIVKEIFKMAVNDVGVSEITTILNDKKYPTPSGYKKTNYSSRLIYRDSWNISSVKKILNNRMYTGDMVQHVQAKVNYKSKKKITLDESLWVIVENTHEPLVSKKEFNLIQKRKKSNNRHYKTTTKREIRLLEGLLYCKECQNRLTVVYRKNHDYWSVNCNRYSRDPKRQRCGSHFFPYNYLEEQIVNKLNEVLSSFIKELNINELNKEIILKKQKVSDDTNIMIKNYEKKKQKIINRLEALYEDRFNGIISAESYKGMAEPYEKDLRQINKEIESIQKQSDETKMNIDRLPDYTKQIKKLLDLKNPKRELLFALIDRIEIDENRIICIKFKYNIIDEIKFKYEEKIGPRNPYGKKGKSNN